MTMEDDAPYTKFYDLGALGRAGAELSLVANPEELLRIARWADIAAVKSFTAEVKLKRHAPSSFSLDADFTAQIVQDCVVTLAPVESRIERHVHRQLHLSAPHRHRGEAIELTEGAGDDDVPEEIESPHYDVAAPLLEELALAIDPYPRAPGVEFAAPAEPEVRRENPFAVLKSLKDRG
jgi:uncharacterized metal-binding protein YceD (DUF177 family)